MTPAQEQVLKRACLELGEHFDGFGLAVTWKTDDGFVQKRISYDGGFYQAMGLFAQAHHDMLNRQREKEQEGT